MPRKPKKVFNPASIRPKKCEIVETMSGERRHGTGVFPSRKQGKKELAKIIATLPPRATPDEVDKYYVRNV